ncbi:RING finger protein 11 [Trichonephila clavata]|uniref:RING finger protein 11 n=1 Tax=Trichonephila clavata TaxID=2740835 RepID=A0A8X6K964_TRICU|nr:RING finger protein 11 [Trichonephila clavata]
MGNCLKSVSTDDISLLRENQSNRESSSDQLGPPPPYQETVSVPVYYPSPNGNMMEVKRIESASYVWENSILGIQFDFCPACISTTLIALMIGL